MQDSQITLSIMNAKTALKKAVSLWGKTAAVKDRGIRQTSTMGRFLVGRVEMGMCFSVKGEGETWEDAFAMADKREQADKARYAALRKGK